MGAGLAMEPGDIAFKSNFACLNPETGIVERRRADRNFEHLGPQLCAALDGANSRTVLLLLACLLAWC
jgi:2,3-bisphosphoglycerate-independent phosphoglycerate mutase